MGMAIMETLDVKSTENYSALQLDRLEYKPTLAGVFSSGKMMRQTFSSTKCLQDHVSPYILNYGRCEIAESSSRLRRMRTDLRTEL